MATPSDKLKPARTWLRFEEGDDKWRSFADQIFQEDTSHKCPTYIHKTPPCQGSCPSGEDIRGYLAIVRGQETGPEGVDWQEYAFQRTTDANPFPSMMGRVCPAPCQDGCNRNDVEDTVGINAVEQFIGDTALENGYKFVAGETTGQKVAVIGGGPGGMAAAYQLRRKGHSVTVFEALAELGGMMRYGIPNYRVPRDKLAAENQRIVDMGDIEVRTNTRVGTDISMEELEKDYDAILWAIGCWTGRALPVDGWEGTPNCVSGVAFLKAFNEGRMKVTGKNLVCVGGGDTSIDVVSVARRVGYHADAGLPEAVVHDDDLNQDQALADAAVPADATLTSLFTKEHMMAAEHEVHDATKEGVTILDGVMPLEVIKGEDGRATGLRVCDCTMDGMTPVAVEGTERVLEADIIVAAIGQGGDLTGLEELDNGRGLMDTDAFYQLPDRPKHFAAGDIVRPHLLTTAIGHASVAADSIDEFLRHEKHKKRPKIDVHHFDLEEKLIEAGLSKEEYIVSEQGDLRGTEAGNFAIHNYEDRSYAEVIESDELFLGHFAIENRYMREEDVPDASEVLGHFHERMKGLEEDNAKAEATRCMSCGMCFECDNCVIFCPQDAVFKVKKDVSTTGRYVDTDYDRCIGCHICADVCPTGYIKMGLGH
jgi:NADPH-dependent glutamate synthase beta subunit-like oxidoreductase